MPSRFTADAPLDIDTLRGARAGARIGHTIEYFPTISSTSDRAREVAGTDAREGVVVIAEAQTQGRGRLGRRWESPPNGTLYGSVLLRPAIVPEDAPLVGLVAGLATAEAVAQWAPQARIKWPNDVLIDGLKTAGNMTELHAGANAAALIVGIGVNPHIGIEELPAELRHKATSVAASSGQAVDRTAFAAALLASLQGRYELFCAGGFQALRESWEGLSCLTGRRVQIGGAGAPQAGTVLGMGDDGTLRLLSEDGCEMRVVAGDVTVLDGYGSSTGR
jgi:BirA family biotin operon repressor/biotin-[acetyl-CoA-carboxylase] ligase